MDEEGNRRQYERRAYKIAVIYYFDDESQAKRIEEANLTVDLSGGGLSMDVRHNIATGTRINLKLLVKTQSIKCTGTVVRLEAIDQSTWKVGVELHLSEKDQEIIVNFLESKKK